MGSLQMDAAHAYKAVVKAMVRTNKRSKITHKSSERKQEIAMLTYKRMGLVREASLKDIDVARKAKLLKDLSVLNKKVEIFKKEDITRDKSLLFLDDSATFKKLFLSYAPNKRNISHFKDVAAFLNNQREYDELIQRYNPGGKLSQEEIVKKTAERVGLNVPFQ